MPAEPSVEPNLTADAPEEALEASALPNGRLGPGDWRALAYVGLPDGRVNVVPGPLARSRRILPLRLTEPPSGDAAARVAYSILLHWYGADHSPLGVLPAARLYRQLRRDMLRRMVGRGYWSLQAQRLIRWLSVRAG